MKVQWRQRLGFGQGEEELPVGEGKEQLLIEVLGEQECPLLAA